jgi:AcrR family transcriptional regulator
MRLKNADLLNQTTVATPTLILDSAEELLSRVGYHGASLRDIATHAGVNSGLVSYYFGTKAKLFEAVINRRLRFMFRLYLKNMALVFEKAAPGLPTPFDILRSYIQTFVSLAVDYGQGWTSYMRLCSLAMALYKEESVYAAMSRFAPVGHSVARKLIKVLPHVRQEEMQIGVYYLEAALGFLFQAPEYLGLRSDHRITSANLNDVVDSMAYFFTSGLLASVASGIPLQPRKSGIKVTEEVRSRPSRRRRRQSGQTSP